MRMDQFLVKKSETQQTEITNKKESEDHVVAKKRESPQKDNKITPKKSKNNSNKNKNSSKDGLKQTTLVSMFKKQ